MRISRLSKLFPVRGVRKSPDSKLEKLEAILLNLFPVRGVRKYVGIGAAGPAYPVPESLSHLRGPKVCCRYCLLAASILSKLFPICGVRKGLNLRACIQLTSRTSSPAVGSERMQSKHSSDLIVTLPNLFPCSGVRK